MLNNSPSNLGLSVRLENMLVWDCRSLDLTPDRKATTLPLSHSHPGQNLHAFQMLKYRYGVVSAAVLKGCREDFCLDVVLKSQSRLCIAWSCLKTQRQIDLTCCDRKCFCSAGCTHDVLSVCFCSSEWQIITGEQQQVRYQTQCVNTG